MKQQITNSILMVRPAAFGMNEQTAFDNYFQKKNNTPELVNDLAKKEFDTLVLTLQKAGINVLVYQDTPIPKTPDSIFPNNWVSFHHDGTVITYPMYAKNRRWERQENIIQFVKQNGFDLKHTVDYTKLEDKGIFLEGTGSMILDRVNKKAYCALSKRSNKELFVEFCNDRGFLPVIFTANQTIAGKRKPIYHTNVMFSLGENFVIICLDSIDNKIERENIIRHLESDRKQIITISENQMNQFAANVIELKAKGGGSILAMSMAAYKVFTEEQKKEISRLAEMVYSPIPTIESNGGGSVRCMIAEIFLPYHR